MVSIPSWNKYGVLPPIDENNPASSSGRSPYEVSITEFILRFNTSKDRYTILDGFLRFRSAIHSVGLVSGFQWLNGSFMEDIESRESRSPGDIDIVTFYDLPPGETQASLVKKNPILFDVHQNKINYHVHPFFEQQGSKFLNKILYWYGLWSHRRVDFRWKGYITVSLNPTNDAAAFSMLKQP